MQNELESLNELLTTADALLTKGWNARSESERANHMSAGLATIETVKTLVRSMVGRLERDPAPVTAALRTAIDDLQSTYDAIGKAGKKEVVVSIGQFRRLTSMRQSLESAERI